MPKDISKTKIFMAADKCALFFASFTAVAFSLYVLGTYQDFLVFTEMMLLKISLFSSMLLMGISLFLSLMILLGISEKKYHIKRKFFLNILFLAVSLVFLFIMLFILACAD